MNPGIMSRKYFTSSSMSENAIFLKTGMMATTILVKIFTKTKLWTEVDSNLSPPSFFSFLFSFFFFLFLLFFGTSAGPRRRADSFSAEFRERKASGGSLKLRNKTDSDASKKPIPHLEIPSDKMKKMELNSPKSKKGWLLFQERRNRERFSPSLLFKIPPKALLLLLPKDLGLPISSLLKEL